MDEDFVDRWEHELMGCLLDAVTRNRSGAELSVWLKLSAANVRKMVASVRSAAKVKDRSADELTDDLIKLAPSLDKKTRDAIKAKLRAPLATEDKK
jgi:hypothetical protein